MYKVSKNLMPSNYAQMSPADIDSLCLILAEMNNAHEDLKALTAENSPDYHELLQARSNVARWEHRLIKFVTHHPIETLDLVQRGRHTRNDPKYNRHYSTDDVYLF